MKTVALIGRPNVGKSTLFNRLIGKREAIETPIAGTTRDRIFGEVFWADNTFELIDVAGIEFGVKSEIDKNIQEGIQMALDTADLLMFVVDVNDPDNEVDKQIARQLRKIEKPVILVANKTDNEKRMHNVELFKRLGAFPIVPISAISGRNTGDLLELTCEKLGDIKILEPIKRDETELNLAVIGRPNVGKSTLINTLVGEKRAVVSSEAGTTRDIISISFMHKGQKIKITDTAGIRRRGKIEFDSIESYSMLRTQKALQECDIAILMIDAEEGLVAADAHILGMAKEWGKGIILAVNKIDLWQNKDEKMAELLSVLQRKLNFTPWLPVVFISAQDSENITPLLTQVVQVDKNRKTVIDQPSLDRILQFAKNENNQLTGLLSLTQKKARSPIFICKYKGKEEPHYTQIRYLENKIRDFYPLTGTPIFIDLYRRARSEARQFDEKNPDLNPDYKPKRKK